MKEVREALLVLKENDCLAKTGDGVKLRGMAVTEAKILLAQRDPKKHKEFQRFMDYMFLQETGLQATSKEAKGKVGPYYARNGRMVRELMAMTNHDATKAISAFNEIGDRMDARGLSWSLKAVLNGYYEWERDPVLYQAETRGSK